MDKVLIVDGDREHLQTVAEGLKKLSQFKVLTASDGESAIEIMKREPISVFVTDISTPKVDGLDLLAYVSREHSNTPCIVMTSYGKPWFKKRADQGDVLYHIEKPVDLGAMASAIFVGLNLNDEGLSMKGISMSSFLPLVELEQRTCRLEVESTGKGKGYFYFFKGGLIDAHYDDMSGEKAARAMAHWGNVKFKFTELPRRRTSKRVKTDLMEMAGASWLRDEFAAEPAAPPPEKAAIEMRPVPESPGASSPPADSTRTAPTQEATEEQKKAARKAIGRFTTELKAVNGYAALCLLDAHGNLLAADIADETLQVETLAGELMGVLDFSRETLQRGGLDECRQLTLHTEKFAVLIISAEKAPKVLCHLLGVLKADGNWYFMKIKLEKILPQILADL